MSLSNIKYQHYHTIKDDGIVSRLKFVRIGEDYQEYGLAIPDVMLNDAIKQSKSYQMCIKYSTSQIPPKKSRGKGSQGKKTVDDSQETVDVSEKVKPEPKPVKRKTASRIVVKKIVTISIADNIILDLDVALDLGKSISLIEAEKEEAAKQVHATHARIVTESVPESAKKNTDSRSSRSVVIQDTPSAPNLKPSTLKPKLKGVQSLTPDEKEAVNIMQALKERKKTSNEYSEEDQLDNEEKDDKEGDVDDEGDDHINEDEEMTNAEVEESGNGDEEDIDATKADAEKIEEAKDDSKKAELPRKQVRSLIYIFMFLVIKFLNFILIPLIEEAKDDSKKAELPPTSSSLSISLGFGDQFLKLYSDTSLICTVKDTTNAEISSLLDIKIQSEVPYIQSLFVLKVHVSVISDPFVLTVQETHSTAPVTTLPLPSVSTTPHIPQQTTTLIPTPPITTKTPTITTDVPESDTLTVVQLRVAKLEKYVSELKNIDHSAETIATLKSQVLTVVDDYLGSKLGDALQKALQKHSEDQIQKHSKKPAHESCKIQTPTINLEQESEKSASEILKIKKEQAEKQKMPKYTIKSTNKATLKEYDKKSALYQTMHENKSFNKNLANQKLYHALMEALIEDENAMDKGVADTVKDNKRKHDDDDDDEDPPAGPNQGKKTKRRRTKESKSLKEPSSTKETPKGKALLKGSKTGKSSSAKETVKEPITEVVMDDAGEDLVCDNDQPQDTSKPKIAKTPNP
ncbi:hypothetical protein Tco_0661293 [Tanacetum coccineum]